MPNAYWSDEKDGINFAHGMLNMIQRIKTTCKAAQYENELFDFQ